VKRADLKAFAERDWAAVADLKVAYWANLKTTTGPGLAIEVGDELRRHAIALRAKWPTAEDRREDLATHARVTAALKSVSIKSR
jgi:hypothetical protein